MRRVCSAVRFVLLPHAAGIHPLCAGDADYQGDRVLCVRDVLAILALCERQRYARAVSGELSCLGDRRQFRRAWYLSRLYRRVLFASCRQVGPRLRLLSPSRMCSTYR